MVKAVLGLLKDTLLELSSLGQQSETAPRPGGTAFRGTPQGLGGYAAAGAGVPGHAAAGGVFGEATLPAWRQLLDRVKSLSRWLQWAERAAQKAADGRIHVSRESGEPLSPTPRSSGQRRPRDIRLRALDPDHFTCPPPAHGEAHQRLPGAAPAGGHVSVLDDDDGEGGEERASTSVRAPSSSPDAAARATSSGVVPEMCEMYHLDAASLGEFEGAAAAATPGSVRRSCEGSTGGGRWRGHGRPRASSPGIRAETLLAVEFPPPVRPSFGARTRSSRRGGGNGDRILNSDVLVVERMASMVCGCVAPTEPWPPALSVNLAIGKVSVGTANRSPYVTGSEAGGMKARRQGVRPRRNGVARPASDAPCAASGDSSSPSLRLLRGVKAAGGGEGARRLEALSRRLTAERAALEQASAVMCLGQGLRDAWDAHVRRASSLSRALATVLAASRKLLASPESAPISRGAAGPLAAALLQTLAMLEPELEDGAARATNHAHKAEKAVFQLWRDFEQTCLLLLLLLLEKEGWLQEGSPAPWVAATVLVVAAPSERGNRALLSGGERRSYAWRLRRER
ncbi:unnamed protein product [Scytosiphon promiscuus]